MSDERRGKNGEKLMAHGRNRSRERFQTVPYRLYKLAEELDIVGTVPRCRDCRVTFRLSPNSPKRKAARSGTAPYSLGASERLQTVPYFSFCHEP